MVLKKPYLVLCKTASCTEILRRFTHYTNLHHNVLRYVT